MLYPAPVSLPSVAQEREIAIRQKRDCTSSVPLDVVMNTMQAGRALASLDGSRAAVRALLAAEVRRDRSRLTTWSAVTTL